MEPPSPGTGDRPQDCFEDSTGPPGYYIGSQTPQRMGDGHRLERRVAEGPGVEEG